MQRILFGFLLLCALHIDAQEKLIYHNIRTDNKGMIVPWYSDDPGTSYDHIINLVWNFWDTMRVDLNGLPYYMNHQVWKPGSNDSRGLGGDQFQMALSSWQLLYAYSGNEKVKQNMKFIADYYLSHSFSPASCKWANLPFPYNTLIYSGIYDGDMVIGQGFLQPDKAGSLGLELVNLYKMSSQDFFLQSTSGRYLQTAIKIAQSLISHLKPGDKDNSPLPFKVNAYTGETGKLKDNITHTTVVGDAAYTSNWCSTMELLLALQKMDPKNKEIYKNAFTVLLNWMKKYPLQNNRWGMFFEDVQGWSDTQINATTFAWFIMQHREYFPDWQRQVTGIFDWVYRILGNKSWDKYGVTVVNEQTIYQTPAQSHSSRQASAELLYTVLSNDTSRKINAIRQLSWSTYMVDIDGKNRFPQDENWLTDGYGDYVRHYLRAMAIYPELSPSADHILSSTSVIQQADYKGQPNKTMTAFANITDSSRIKIFYRAFDSTGTEKIRMTQKPTTVLINTKAVKEISDVSQQGYQWKPLQSGGFLIVHRLSGAEVVIAE